MKRKDLEMWVGKNGTVLWARERGDTRGALFSYSRTGAKYWYPNGDLVGRDGTEAWDAELDAKFTRILDRSTSK